jgi:hypothetical protein
MQTNLAVSHRKQHVPFADFDLAWLARDYVYALITIR